MRNISSVIGFTDFIKVPDSGIRINYNLWEWESQRPFRVENRSHHPESVVDELKSVTEKQDLNQVDLDLDL